MSRRIMTTENLEEDVRIENHLRPQLLEDYIGQAKAKETLKIYIEAAKSRGEALDHVLFYGPPGLGKTTLSGIIANEMGVHMKVTSGPAIEKPGEMAAILNNLQEHDVLFVDEIHRLNRQVEEVLYPAMEDYAIDIMIGKGASARSIRLDLPKFTLVGATTRAGLLSAPLRDRFGVMHHLEFYTHEELKTIIIRSAQVLGVEIDEKITDLSRKYFSLPEDVPVTTYDGRAYLQAVDEMYDVIMVDAYQDITIPFQMSSVEFFNMVKDHLTENGVMVVNMNMRGSGEGNINQYLADTIASVFGTVYTADVKGSTNRELFASNQEDMLDTLKNNAGNLANADLQNMMLAVADTSTQYDGGDYIMTDDKAPVELLGMQVIDQVIKEEVAYYKGIYEEQGLDGLLQSL